MCVYVASSGFVPIFSLKSPVWNSHLCLEVNIVLHVSGKSQYYPVFFFKSLMYLSFWSSLAKRDGL